jgi:hypothetical protein
MNDGKAVVDDIISWFEDSLQMDLCRSYRKFIDIGRRKTFSYTKSTDDMRRLFIKRSMKVMALNLNR